MKSVRCLPALASTFALLLLTGSGAKSLHADAFQVKQINNVLGRILPSTHTHTHTHAYSSNHQNSPLRHRYLNIPFRGGALSNRIQSPSPSKLHMSGAPIIFDNAPFTQSSLVILGANSVGFLISLLTGSHLHLDLLGTGAFALASLPTLLSSHCTSMRVTLSSAAVVTWGTKLASFLFFRALKVKTDTRLDDTLSTVSGTCEYNIICILCILYIYSYEYSYRLHVRVGGIFSSLHFKKNHFYIQL